MSNFLNINTSLGGGIFLLSSERSGTNLLRERLAEFSSEVCSIPPVHILRTLGYWEPIMGPFSDGDRWEIAIKYALRSCYERAVPWPHIFDFETVKKIYEDLYGDDRSLVRLTDTLYRMYAAQEEKSWYFCKDLWLSDFSLEISTQIPNSYFIHLFRDPRDYTASQKKRPFGIQSAYTLATLWKKECNAALRSCASPLVSNSHISLSYESFIQNENSILYMICHAIGISPNSQEKYLPREKSNRNIHEFHEWKNLHLPTDPNNFGKYKKLLSSREVKIIESICWNTMKHIGYTPDSSDRPKITFIDRCFTQHLGNFNTLCKYQKNRIRQRAEPINRWASTPLVKELTRKFR